MQILFTVRHIYVSVGFEKENNMKKISLIIPCYNCEKTLKRCLKSVFGQTYKNVEVIAVNDGSTDGTLKKLKKYQKRHENLLVIDKENGGVSSARNLALTVATGDYIQFLDSDDNFLGKNVLEKLAGLLEEKRVDMVVFNFKHPCFQSHLSAGIYDIKNPNDLKKYYQDFFACSLPWNKLIKKECLRARFDESMNFAEDEIFNLENLNNVNKIYYTDEILYNYYCAPARSGKRDSLVNRLYAKDNFWEDENTIWYKSVENIAKRKPIFEKYFRGYISDFTLTRPFDFFFYDFAFMNYLNVSEQNQKKQCENILKKPMFLKILKSLKRYGLILKENPLGSMEKFVELGSRAYHELQASGLSLKLYIVLFSIFGECFFEASELNASNILAETQIELRNKSTAEAKYVLNLLNEAGV